MNHTLKSKLEWDDSGIVETDCNMKFGEQIWVIGLDLLRMISSTIKIPSKLSKDCNLSYLKQMEAVLGLCTTLKSSQIKPTSFYIIKSKKACWHKGRKGDRNKKNC